jgi:hypothetical protein
MSSARWPEPGGAAPSGATPALRVDPALAPAPAAPSEPAPDPLLSARTAHLVPCARCSALNGRSALACWSCEGDLHSVGPFAPVAPPAAAAVPEPVVVRAFYSPPAVEPEGAQAGEAHGLHVVPRACAPASVPPAAAPEPPDLALDLTPDLPLDLPLLTVPVEEPAPAPFKPAARWPARAPLIALTLAALVLLAIAASLRWRAPASVASPPRPIGGPIGEATFNSVLEAPAPGLTDQPTLSFPAREVLPERPPADPPPRLPAHNKPAGVGHVGGKLRAASCTSNMAALGLCTLEAASAKE